MITRINRYNGPEDVYHHALIKNKNAGLAFLLVQRAAAGLRHTIEISRANRAHLEKWPMDWMRWETETEARSRASIEVADARIKRIRRAKA